MADKAREIQLARQKGVKLAVHLPIQSSVFRQAYRGILRYSRLHGPWVILSGPSLEQVAAVKGVSPIGLICATYDPSWLATYKALDIPIVNIATAPVMPGVGAVHVDNRASAEKAVDYFVARGFNHFACVSHQRTAAIVRQEAYEREVTARGFHCETFVVEQADAIGTYSYAGLDEMLKNSPKPLALLATEEFLGWTTIGKCLDTGIAVPEEVAVLTIGNDDIISEASDVPMSTITLAGEQLGFEGAHLLHRMLQGEPAPATPILIPPVEVLTKQSTDVLAIEDAEVAQVVRYIREKACTGLTVADILHQFAMDRRKLERRFKTLFNRSPYDEILRVRIERARTLLTQSDFKLPDIAEQCGFAHIQNFGRAFRLATGHTPASFRRKFRHASAVPRQPLV